MKESAVDSHIVLAAAQAGDYLWRNNNGAFQDESGNCDYFKEVKDWRRNK